VKQLIVLLLFNCVLVSLPAVLVNFVMGTECKEVNGTAMGLFNSVCRGSVINIMSVSEIDAMQIEASIFFAAIVLNIVFIAYLEVLMEGHVGKMAREKQTAADYSFVIKGLPSDITVTEIQKYVEDKMLFSGAPDVDIIKIYLIYNFKEYLKLLQLRQELIERKIHLSFTRDCLEEENLRSKDYEKKLELQTRRTEVENSIKATEVELERA
jgi:hypothetical protein